MAQKKITETHVKSLLKSGQTKVIKGFKNKEGNPFDALLKIINGEVKFDFQKEVIANCPICEKGQVVETAKAFSCDQWRETGCKFAIWKEIASRKMTKSEVKSLLKNKELNDLEGFKARSGDSFKASLQLTEDGRAQFKPR